MKVKVCPRCGSKELGERWCKGRTLQQYCTHASDTFYDRTGERDCEWVGEPYTPPRRRITNATRLRIDDFYGWHYIVYDKYGHVQTDSATYDTKAEAMKELEDEFKTREGYVNPAAPLTAVLFNVPSSVTIKGTMFKLKNGVVTKTK